MEKHIEEIECPECGKRQIATVLHTFPWWSYVHDCVSCKYTIMESEWNLISTDDEIKQANSNNVIKHQLKYNIDSAKVSWCPICHKHFYNERNEIHTTVATFEHYHTITP